jgi:hypothetical protein
MNTFKVNIQDTATGNGLGTVRVEAADKEDAAIEAQKAMARHAKEFNAKYHGQIADWQIRSENASGYTTWGIRKMPAKKVSA